MIRFFRYKDVWRYKTKGNESGSPVTPAIMETALGVVGGPLVYVCRDYVPNYKLRIEIRNGFIHRASLVNDDQVPFSSGAEVTEFTIKLVTW